MYFITIIVSVFKDLIHFFWPLNIKRKLFRFIALLLIIVGTIYLLNRDTVSDEKTAPVVPLVSVGTVASVLNSSETSFIGNIRSVSEAQIQAETGGRITSVPVKAGSKVAAGSIIATIENASERASVLQAQGSYEAAQAGSAQSDVGITEAQNAKKQAQDNAVTTYKNAYTSVSGIVYGSLDQFYSNPSSQVPGVRLSSADVSLQNTERVKLAATLPTWQQNTLSLNSDDDLNSALNEAEVVAKQVLVLVDDFIRAFTKASINEQYSEADYIALGTKFNGIRSQLVALLSSIDSARTGLKAAEEAIKRANISASGSVVSSADAQVKIALGSLRAAQANFEKTILRSPISGTVDVLRVKTGDYISAFTPVAQVSSAGGLEISLFVGENDLALFTVGNTVSINGTATGTVVNIAPAIDPLTFKTEIKISVADGTNLTTGGTATVSLISDKQNNDTRILVPITAVKFADTDGSIFIVEDNQLKSLPVVLGPVVGSLVTIVSGIERDTVFVIDGRGKTEGLTVEVKQ